MIIDGHVHLNRSCGTIESCVRELLHYADKFDIDKLCLSLGFGREERPTPEQLRVHNDQVAQALPLAPDRLIGFVYLNPMHTRASMDEIDRHVVDGPMRGIKLWIALPCSDPLVDPIAERAAELRLPVLQHTWLKATGNQPFESTPDDMAALAARHPQTNFLFGHTGGDWEYGIMAVRQYPNVYADLAGGAPTAGLTELAVQELGARRVVYGSDAPGRSYASQIAKVHGAAISDTDKELILGANMELLLSDSRT